MKAKALETHQPQQGPEGWVCGLRSALLRWGFCGGKVLSYLYGGKYLMRALGSTP